MVEQVVGLRFVAEGFEQSLRNIDRHTKSVGELTNATKRLHAESSGASAQLIGNVRGMNQYGEVLDIAGKTTNRFGMQLQQAGYQVGDFFVQVQGGTNIAVAFGQQMSQLLGVFGAGGAIAGAGVAIATAIIAPILEMRKNASDAQDQFDKLSDAIREYSEASRAASMSTEDMNEKFGQFASFARGALFEMEKIKRIKLDEAIDAVAGSIEGIDVSKLQGQIPSFINAQIRDWLGLNDGIKQNNKSVLEFVLALQRLEGSEGTRGQLEAARNLSSILTSTVGEYEEMNEQQRSFFEGLQSLISELSAMEGGFVASSDAMKQIAEDERAYQEFLNERFLTNEQLTEELTNQLNLNQAILQFGKDSTVVRGQEAAIERELFEARLRSTNLLEPQIQHLLAIYDQNVLVTNQLAESEKNAKDLADALKEAASAMSSLEGFSANVDKALAVSVAKVDALKRGVDATIAGNIAGMRVDLEARRQSAIAAGADPLLVGAEAAITKAQIEALERSERERVALQDSRRGGTTSTALDAVQQLEQQIARTRELTRLSADQAALQEEIWRITDALGDESGRYSDQRIADIARENLALQEQQRIMEEAYERQQSLYDQMSSSMENAFMSIVEGTASAKDAFRTMAYEVIKELYRVLVVQQIVGSFNATTGAGTGIVGAIGRLFTGGFAQGGAFMGGNVTAFANGGVVGSPTMFPMSGGRTGLMGEAGPEAIMPLKRTSSGKLGVVAEGGGAVVVNNNFNISANGDESVKRIVMEQAPAIAKMTQSAVIDARRRGGQMKAAFG